MNIALKTVIITGGNTGLGFSCAKAILERKEGWHVVIACRNSQKAEQAVVRLKAHTGNKNIGFQLLDLASLQSVRNFASSFLSIDYPPLHGIICNAGAALGDEITTTEEGIETTFQGNCLGHFLLIKLLRAQLQGKGRILFVSSELHRSDGPMNSFHPNYTSAKEMAFPTPHSKPIEGSGSQRYSATKLCLLFYTYYMDGQLSSDEKSTLSVNAFNPGLMPDTGLGGLNEKPLRKFFLKYILPFFAKGAVSTPSKSGAILANLLMDEAYEDISGKYFDRDKMIPSSDESYDKNKQRELWQFSEQLVGD